MSVSLYKWAESCEDEYCIGDCDLCNKHEKEEQEETDDD